MPTGGIAAIYCPESSDTRHSCQGSQYWDPTGCEMEGRPGHFAAAPYSATTRCTLCGVDLITHNLAWPHGIQWSNRKPRGAWTLMTSRDQITDPVFIVEEDPY